MAIIGINRDNYAGAPGIIRLQTTNTVSDALASGYLTTEAAQIFILNNGPFEFVVGDMVAVAASDGNALCNFTGDDFTTLVSMI